LGVPGKWGSAWLSAFTARCWQKQPLKNRHSGSLRGCQQIIFYKIILTTQMRYSGLMPRTAHLVESLLRMLLSES